MYFLPGNGVVRNQAWKRNRIVTRSRITTEHRISFTFFFNIRRNEVATTYLTPNDALFMHFNGLSWAIVYSRNSCLYRVAAPHLLLDATDEIVRLPTEEYAGSKRGSYDTSSTLDGLFIVVLSLVP